MARIRVTLFTDPEQCFKTILVLIQQVGGNLGDVRYVYSSLASHFLTKEPHRFRFHATMSNRFHTPLYVSQSPAGFKLQCVVFGEGIVEQGTLEDPRTSCILVYLVSSQG